VGNGNGTKLGSNSINTRPKQKVLEIQITNLMTRQRVPSKTKKKLRTKTKSSH